MRIMRLELLTSTHGDPAGLSRCCIPVQALAFACILETVHYIPIGFDKWRYPQLCWEYTQLLPACNLQIHLSARDDYTGGQAEVFRHEKNQFEASE
jgi:hypothetical protein